ncbi:MAG: PAS domain-containing protein [Gemmataceae bacterium]|nr:PAS domain-containing protein [Gemmataceae bacterium]
MSPLPSASVLLIDVEEARRHAIRGILQKAGLEVRDAASLGAALAGLSSPPAIAIVRMEWNAGDECAQLRADPRTAGAALLVLAAPPRSGEDEAPTEADGLLVCPVHPVELLTAVRALLRHRRTEEALRENDERFRQMTENIREVFWMADARDKRVLYVSPAFEEVWGRSCQSIIDDPDSWHATIHGDDRERVLDQMKKRARHGGHDTQFRILRPDGSVRWIWDRSFPVRNAAGEVYRMVGIAEDITERKRLEEQYRQAQKLEAVGRLAGGVAHDFNNVLTAIAGYSELIMLDSPDPMSSPYRNAEEISRTADRAASLTRQLLAYSRQQVVAPRVLNLNLLLSDMEKLLRRLIREDVVLTLALDPHLRLVEIDPGQVEQVVMNLTVNACDAMPQAGRLTIQTANVELDEAYAWSQADVQPGAYVLLTVTDTGSGMTEEVRTRLFEPFFTTKEPGKGTGLGLATVHSIVKANGGHIEVASQPGKGAEFKIYLPQVMERAKLDAATARPGKAPTGSETILLVEDEDIVRNLARTVLQRAGYRVLVAADGVEALQVCEQHTGAIELLVTDVVMPQMNGRDLAERLTQKRPALKVLFMSGYTGFINEPLAVPTRAGFLQKPFAPDALARQVRSLLDE